MVTFVVKLLNKDIDTCTNYIEVGTDLFECIRTEFNVPLNKIPSKVSDYPSVFDVEITFDQAKRFLCFKKLNCVRLYLPEDEYVSVFSRTWNFYKHDFIYKVDTHKLFKVLAKHDVEIKEA